MVEGTFNVCGGRSTDMTKFCNYDSSSVEFRLRGKKGKYMELNVYCPEEIIEWIPDLVLGVAATSGYRKKTFPLFVFVRGQVKSGSNACGFSCKGDNLIMIILSKKFLGYLKRINPDKTFPMTAFILAELIWHELWAHHDREGISYRGGATQNTSRILGFA